MNLKKIIRIGKAVAKVVIPLAPVIIEGVKEVKKAKKRR